MPLISCSQRYADLLFIVTKPSTTKLAYNILTVALCLTLSLGTQWGGGEGLPHKATNLGGCLFLLCHRVDNCLQSLVGILTGNKIELQEQVAWCLTNVATGRPEHALAVAKAAAPYFITFVSGSSPLLQVCVCDCACV